MTGSRVVARDKVRRRVRKQAGKPNPDSWDHRKPRFHGGQIASCNSNDVVGGGSYVVANSMDGILSTPTQDCAEFIPPRISQCIRTRPRDSRSGDRILPVMGSAAPKPSYGGVGLHVYRCAVMANHCWVLRERGRSKLTASSCSWSRERLHSTRTTPCPSMERLIDDVYLPFDHHSVEFGW